MFAWLFLKQQMTDKSMLVETQNGEVAYHPINYTY